VMRFLVLQHHPVEHPGHLRDLWRAEGIAWDPVELDEGEPIPDDLDRYDAIVSMGGPMDVWEEAAHPWIAAEKALLRRWVGDLDRPFLGICLGHQMLAATLGGRVGMMDRAEVGVDRVVLTQAGVRDPLFAGLSPEPTVFQWHGAGILELPPGAAVLAQSEPCPVQAFSAGSCAYGLQFHFEVTDRTVAEWAGIPAYKASLEELFGSGAVDRVAESVAAGLSGFNAVARDLNSNFLAAVRSARQVRVAAAAAG